MKVYVLNFADQECYCAYATFEKAKAMLWEAYCEEVAEETRAKYLEEDLRTINKGFITDYGWISDTDFVDE